MVVYESVTDIPAEVLANGGVFDVLTAGIPDEFRQEGKAFCAIPEADAMQSGLIDKAVRNPDGTIMRIKGSMWTENLTLSAVSPEPQPMFWNGLLLVLIAIAEVLVAHFTGVLVLLAIIALVAGGAYVASKIYAPKYGRIIKDNPDGSSTYESADGSLYAIYPDGTYRQIKGPNPSPFGDLTGALKWTVGGAAAIGLVYMGFKAWSAYRTGEPFRAPLIEQAGATVYGGARAVGRGAKAVGTRAVGAVT